MKSTPRLLCTSGIVLAAALFTPAAQGAVRSKNNTAGNLNVAAGWNVASPGTNDIAQWDAVVTGPSAWNLGADLNWLGISIVDPGGAVTINAGNTLTLGAGGINMSTATQNLTISSDVRLLDYRWQAWDVAAGRALTLNGNTITRAVGATLHVQGAGTVSVSNLTTTNGIIGAWASHGTGTSTTFATISGGNIVGLTGTAAANAAAVTDTTGTANYSLAAVGALGAGASFNTLRYTGATGTITGDFTANGLMNAGGNTLTVASNVTIGDTRELVVNGANGAQVFTGIISDHAGGASGLTKTGAGTVTLSAENTYSGVTVVNRGTLRITHPKALGSTAGGTVIVAGDNASSGNPVIPGGQLLIEASDLVIDEPLTFIGRGSNLNPSGALKFVGNNNTLTGAITSNTTAGGVRIETNGKVTFTGGITDTGNGLLVLNPAANAVMSFTTKPLDLAGGSFYLDTVGTVEVHVGGNIWGTTRVAGGTVKLFGENFLPANALLGIGLGYRPDGTLDLNGFNQTTGLLESLVATDGNRTITSATPATLTLNQTAARSYDGQITGAVSIIKEGSQSLTLLRANSHTGDTRVNAGALNLGHVDALKDSTLDTGEVGLQSVGFTAGGTNTYNIGGLKGSNPLSIGNNSISVGANQRNTTFAGDLTSTGGDLIKVGTGTLLLDGTVSGSGSADVKVNEGALGGNGTILVPVTVAAGAALQVGDGLFAGENLIIGSDLTLANDSVIKLTLGAGLTHSTLMRYGGDWSFDSNQTFTFTGTGITTGVYQDLIMGLSASTPGLATIGTWVITNEGLTGTFSFDGNNVDLTVTSVPEPSVGIAILGGVALLSGFRRRRLA